jgi:hypothetical protein
MRHYILVTENDQTSAHDIYDQLRELGHPILGVAIVSPEVVDRVVAMVTEHVILDKG